MDTGQLTEILNVEGPDPAPGWEAMTVLIVEDHEIVREGMRRIIGDILAKQCRVIEIFEVSNLAEAKSVLATAKDKLDLVVLDLDLPDAHGADAVNGLRENWGGIPVVVVSANEDWPLAANLMTRGVLGFIPKKSSVEIMVNALRLILAGGRYFPEEVFRLMKSEPGEDVEFEEQMPPTVPEGSESALGKCLSSLPPRHKEVLSLMLEGRSNKEIARQLGLSLGTTKNYVASVMRFLGVTSRLKAMRAVVLGGVSLDEGAPHTKAPHHG